MPGDRPKDESRGKRCAICGRTKTDVGAPLHKVQGVGMGELWICDDCMKEYAKELGLAANEASPEPRRQLLGADPLLSLGPDQDRLGADLDVGLGTEVDGQVVHRHGSDQRPPLAADQHLGLV